MNETAPITAGDVIESATPDMAQTRSCVYRLLAAVLMKELTSGLLAALRSEDVADALEELEPSIRRFVEDSEPEKLLNDLAEEYAALFLVPGGIPPYESVRLHGMLNQKPSWEVEEFYRKCGLVVREECRILPDHLGMELDFMGYLAEKEAEARRNKEEEQAAMWLGLQGEF
jgi:TorA maturation chaperone TorD